MREISFVKRLKFNFNGSVTKKALVIGDADNDQNNELVCANLQGILAIFKGCNPNSCAEASDLGMVTACVIGDVINAGKNYVAAINTEGMLYIFDVPAIIPATDVSNRPETTNPIDCPETHSSKKTGIKSPLPQDTRPASKLKLNPLYEQRMPANCKELLLADLDGDGQYEVIVGMTDRVLRTYKWIKIGPDRGKFVGLYKWEFADQIGAVSLNPSALHENCQDIIVAQPGGTYAKLECFDKKPSVTGSKTTSTSGGSANEVSHQQRQTSNNDDSPAPVAPYESAIKATASVAIAPSPTNDGSDNVRTEYISKLTPEYHQLVLGQMRNHHISTEILGGIRDSKNSDSYSLIVIATLDGTLMLVNKDEILWCHQVDHQLFALAILEMPKAADSSDPILSQSESTCTIVPNQETLGRSRQSSDSSNCSGGSGSGCTQQQQQATGAMADTTTIRAQSTIKKKTSRSQYFVVCAWNGRTYIIDEERNYLRFKFDEAVSAFTAGNYHFSGKDYTSLVYATFNNQIVLYYDVILDSIRPMYLLSEVMSNHDHVDLLRKLECLAKRLGFKGDLVQREILGEEQTNCGRPESASVADQAETVCAANNERAMRIHEMLQEILYNVTDEELYKL